jgi:hypothetical protein
MLPRLIEQIFDLRRGEVERDYEKVSETEF